MNGKPIPALDILMDRLQKTINLAWNIGNRIHKANIDRWLDNFTGDALYASGNYPDRIKAREREKQLALFLLCNFTFYNESEIKHLVKIMLNKYVHSVFTSEKKESISDDDFNGLIEKTQFTFLGNISESSSYLLYHFRQENDLSKQCFIEKSTTENVVFIDDFSITGIQAYEYISQKINSPEWDKNKKIYVLLMIATCEAMKGLEEIDCVKILPCIVLDDRSKAFSNSSIIFAGYEDNCKNDAKIMCEYYGEKIKTNGNGMTSLGFNGGGYMFGSYYNIPDNTLPIFWSSQNGWSYLFKRYDKKYGANGASMEGRYV